MDKNYLMHSALSLCPKSHYGVLDQHSVISINQDKICETPKLTSEEKSFIEKVFRYVLDPYELFEMADRIDDKYQMFLINFSSAYMNLLCGTLHDSISYSQEEELIQCWKSPDIHHKHMFIHFFNNKVKQIDNLKKVKDYYINKVRDFAPNSYRFSSNEPNCHNATFSLLGDIDIELEDYSRKYIVFKRSLGGGKDESEKLSTIAKKSFSDLEDEIFSSPMRDDDFDMEFFPDDILKSKNDGSKKVIVSEPIIDLLGEYYPVQYNGNPKPKIILYSGTIGEVAKTYGISRIGLLINVLFHEMFHAIMDRDYLVKAKDYYPQVEEPLAELWALSLMFYLKLKDDVYRTEKFKNCPYDFRNVSNDFWSEAFNVSLDMVKRKQDTNSICYYGLGYDLFKRFGTTRDFSIGLFYSGVYVGKTCSNAINSFVSIFSNGYPKNPNQVACVLELLALTLHLKKRELIDSVREYL